MAYSPPPENTHASLVEAMRKMDGVEFDLRLTADEKLVVHHDHTVSIPKENLEGRSQIVSLFCRFFVKTKPRRPSTQS